MRQHLAMPSTDGVLRKGGAERKAQYAAAVKNARALEVEFTAYGEPLEQAGGCFQVSRSPPGDGR